MNKIFLDTLTKFSQILEKFPDFRYIGDPILRSKTTNVSGDEVHEISKKLQELLRAYRNSVGYGRGLAAPQIGKNKSIFVTYIDEKFETFINPKIVEKSNETNFYRELCLSSGMLIVDVERAKWIVMEWTDLDGESHTQRFEGFLARLYQHEEAHLRGVVNVDEALAGSIEFLSRDPLQEKIRNSRF